MDSDESRFSRVARCMLDIIEDLQRQHREQQQQGVAAPPAPAPVQPQPNVPPKPTRLAAAAAPPATPPRVSRNGRRKLPTPQPPSGADLLSGADYHLYEEIIYDVGGCGGKCSPTRYPLDLPPPLPARPARPAKPTRPTSLFPPRKHNQPEVAKPCCWTPVKLSAPQRPAPAPANVYTFGSQRRLVPPPVAVQVINEDEYGFRSIPPPHVV